MTNTQTPAAPPAEAAVPMLEALGAELTGMGWPARLRVQAGVAEGDPDRACELAGAALDNLARYWYATGMERLRSVRQSLTRWESWPCVRSLDDQLYDWNTTVSAMSG